MYRKEVRRDRHPILRIKTKLDEIPNAKFRDLVQSLINRYHLPESEVLSILNNLSQEPSVPVSAFQEKALTYLEVIVKFLKEEERCPWSKIAILLNRSEAAIVGVYSAACEKKSGNLQFVENGFTIPVSVFSSRNLSCLESLAEHLKDSARLRYSEIARLIGRDQRTIWTAYVRAKQKRFP